MNSILDDLIGLSPKRRTRRLETLARDALPCHAVNTFSANPDDGLTVGLWVESGGRPDLTDLARVIDSEPGGRVTTAWSTLSPNRKRPYWRLLLHVEFKRPVNCAFVARFDIRSQSGDPLRETLPLLLAASGFALCFDGFPDPAQPAVWIPAPPARTVLLEVLAGAGI